MSTFDIIQKLNWEGKTILIIENDEASFLLISEYLVDTNARFIHIDTQEAVTFASKGKIDLIIMGINYREMESEFELTKRLKLKYDIPFIACSACYNRDDHKISECYQAGYNEFISKPIDFNLLANILTTYL